MKKQILTVCAAVASAVAVASTVESSNTFGVMKVYAPTNNQTILAVPWDAVGGGSAYITNLVLTTGLKPSTDTLLWYSPTEKKYKGWTVSSDGKYWAEGIAVGENDPFTASGAETVCVARGQAVVLTRGEAKDGATDTDKDYAFVYGQYNSAATGAVTINAKAGDNNGLTFLAPPYASNFDVKNLNDTTDGYLSVKPATGDMILVAANKVFTYDATNSKWVWSYQVYEDDQFKERQTKDSSTAGQLLIEAGKGAWYIRTSTDAMTVTWKASE